MLCVSTKARGSPMALRNIYIPCDTLGLYIVALWYLRGWLPWGSRWGDSTCLPHGASCLRVWRVSVCVCVCMFGGIVLVVTTVASRPHLDCGLVLCFCFPSVVCTNYTISSSIPFFHIPFAPSFLPSCLQLFRQSVTHSLTYSPPPFLSPNLSSMSNRKDNLQAVHACRMMVSARSTLTCPSASCQIWSL